VDPIVVEVGARRVPVRCATGCDGARAELGALRERCIDDPTSTPHHVVAAGASLVALGCCTDAMTAYRQACGIEALEACSSRWIAECESGRIAPTGTAATGEGR
jgi:hypothetical protein